MSKRSHQTGRIVHEDAALDVRENFAAMCKASGRQPFRPICSEDDIKFKGSEIAASLELWYPPVPYTLFFSICFLSSPDTLQIFGK